MADARPVKHTASETTADSKDEEGVRWMDRLKYLRTKLKKVPSYEDVIEKACGWVTLLDGNYKVMATPLDTISPKNDNLLKTEQNCDLIDIDGPWTLPAGDVTATPPPAPDSHLPLTTETAGPLPSTHLTPTILSNTTKTSETTTLVTPQKATQLKVNSDALLPSFSEALNFTGNGTTSGTTAMTLSCNWGI